ncbi:cupin domain-containing protein [Echinimonas agarilytica]|uniref:Cupin domain-containing protein n=1 Tax=Echinimonas agarilytica TaxID=1215918 RepID=A0AA41W8A9_9GAMM|nr:cupin domain-containing protein [Echinimonas agarilytica]MCM2680271.1 cupin domain-containing protein [Echinimonas agarilytica]
MLNMNFEQRVVVHSNALEWQPSPAAGVERKPLARENKEQGHATSIVRYAAGSRFKAHPHPGGEEIFVLEGIFSDESGDYGPGTYIRNPPGTQHAPYSSEGCVIFVKLHQFNPSDSKVVRIATEQTPWLPGQGGLQVMPLHSFEHENVALVKWPAHEKFKPHRHFGGEEVLVLSGEFKDDLGSYPAGSWIRSPHMSRHHPFVEQQTVIWVKTGHLPVGD